MSHDVLWSQVYPRLNSNYQIKKTIILLGIGMVCYSDLDMCIIEERTIGNTHTLVCNVCALCPNIFCIGLGIQFDEQWFTAMTHLNFLLCN